MVCIIPFFAGDTLKTKRLLRWIRDLGGAGNYGCMLVVDPDTPWREASQCLDLARDAFALAEIRSPEEAVKGWIPGSNSLFREAAQFAQDQGSSFLFLEPDAVPLVPEWTTLVEAERDKAPGKFIGSLVHHANPTWPNPYLEGVAVYPHNAWRRMESCFRMDVSWTRACAPAVVPEAINSPLFQHLWGETGNPPVFAERNVPGTNVYCLEQLKQGAAIFHRNKDGSLIRLLRQRRGLPPDEPDKKLLVVLPFCNKDASLFVKNLDWMLELDGHIPFECLLSWEEGTSRPNIHSMTTRAERLFLGVRTLEYPRPPAGCWPPTIAFVHAARAIQNMWEGAWFWCEYDLIPIRRGWVQTLWDLYCRAGKPFMGPIVAGQGHMNGTGFYPADTPTRIPRAMLDLGAAWDVSMKEEMIRQCHDCGQLLQHVWVVDRRGRFQPNGGGPPPTFRDQHSLNQLLPGAFAFHRSKDGTLIARLRERQPKTQCERTSSLSPA